jgi:hypothetical protein
VPFVNIATISESEEPLDSGIAMPFSNPQLAVAILAQATTGRPLVLSKGIGGAWLLQCNGYHFIQDPANKQEVAVVEKTLNELADAGYLQAEGWVGATRNIYLTDAGRDFVQRVMEELAKRKK